MNKSIKYTVVVNVIAVLLMIANLLASRRQTYTCSRSPPIQSSDETFLHSLWDSCLIKQQVSVLLFKVLEAHKRQSMVSVDI